MNDDFVSTRYWDPTTWEQLKKLNLGCGNKAFGESFINVDNLDLPGVNVVADAGNLSAFEDNTVDFIYASHLLEHFPRTKTFGVLKEWYRVLKWGGMVRIAVPDFDAVFEWYNRTKDIENIQNWIYGNSTQTEKLNEFRHHRIFNFSNLRAVLTEIGFKRISRYNPQKTNHSHYDDFSFARFPHMSTSPDAIWMSLNVEATK